jgi:subtilase family serine protease
MHTRMFAIAALSVLAGGVTAAAAATVPVEMGTVDGVRDLGPAPVSVRVHIALVLNHHRPTELDRLVDEQADPGSRLYHRFLTPSEFSSYFSATPAEYARVCSALQRAGFTITHTFPNRTVVDAAAPAPLAARYFGTDIHRVLSPDRGLSYTNARAGVVPQSIAGLTLGVFGLDAAHEFRARPIRFPAGVPHPIRPNVRFDNNPLFGPDGGYGPQIFIDAYDLPAASGTTGTGRASGVDMSGDFLDGDLAAYLSYFGVSRTGPPTKRIAIDGGAPPFPGGAAEETTLDVETIVSLAPGTALYVYEMPNLDNQPIIDAFNQAVSDNIVDTLNSSWDTCETLGHGRFARALDAIEEQGAAQGITFHSSSGDWGIHAANCWRKISVDLPSSTPHNVAVGGTALAVDPNTGLETSEVGWNGPGSDATGGGVSVVFGLPAYQRGVANVIASGRNVPDVAFDASSLMGTSWYFDGAWDGPTGGTSLASPIFGAALTEIDQLQNARAGNFNVALYKTWLANGYASGSTLYVRDITQGSIPPYYARSGYDQMSGIGAMQAYNFGRLLPRPPRVTRGQRPG